MTVLNESNAQLLSELELGARKPRRVKVRRQTQATVDERLGEAKTAQAVEAAVRSCEDVHCQTISTMESEHEIALDAVRVEARADGVTEGQRLASAELDESFEDDVNSRVCDHDRKLPWSVGVIIAGEQHRILQALADYLDGFDQPTLTATGFARTIGMPYFPERTPSPDAVTQHNCELPPETNAVRKLPQDNFTPHWIYYADQLDKD